MDIQVTSYLQIIYYAFVKYVRKWEHNETVEQISWGFKKYYDSLMKDVLYNSVIEIDINMKLVILTKMCLNETCNRRWKKGDVLLPLLFNFPLKHVFRSFEFNQEEWN
jgi:hypothetical protein